MPAPRIHVAVLLAGGLLLAGAAHAGKARPIVPDGEFDDWKKAGKPFVDPAGDGTEAGLDFGRLWLVNDDDALYLRLEMGHEVLLQADGAFGNSARLYLDTDGKRKTGLPVEGLGAEIEVRFGEQELIRYDRGGTGTAEPRGRGTAMGFPTFSSDVFEIRVELPPWEKKRRRKVRLVWTDAEPGGDRAPDTGVVTYKYPKKKRVQEPAAIDWSRADDESVRLLSLNVEASNIVARQGLYRRLLQAVDPDILAFQSLTAWDAARTADFVASVLPAPAGGSWFSAGIADIVLVSAYPIVASAPVDSNLVALLDLPDALTEHDLVLFNAHPPCCTDDAGRDREVDNLMAIWRDLLEGGGPFAADPRDAVILAGDFNLVGFRRQFEALVHGRFIDPSHGENFDPGRDNGSLAVAPLRHSNRRMAFTWRRETSRFAPGRLDFIFFSDDVAKLEKSFVVDTESMPDETLAELGLERSDSLRVSDHLALVADFSFATRRQTGGEPSEN